MPGEPQGGWLHTIDDVIQKLDQIVEACRRTQNRLGYFAVLYRQVTVRVKQGIDRGEFEDNPRMERLDVIFAKRFIDAWEQYERGEEPTLSWKLAFGAAEESRMVVLQHLLLGINAHINLDLGIAAVETMEGKPLEPLRGDFNKINAVLAELTDGVKENIGRISPVFRLLIRFARGRDEMLVNFSINTAREGAWKFAGEYAKAASRPALTAQRDHQIAALAQRLINPGKRLSRILYFVSLAEWRTVSGNMAQLDRLVKRS
ncbi:MAG: DUF5995 family protein [Candidatus Cyclonatronum sp.]|uniref:DUF5995 family protein n=1 Tax=Cyclonatronum sp. TaxID=3024185 RepID=UPI0025C15149|nr:DUF5995 family protein [Cyclonatronum sp.]MCH8488065.1 DUF5995 family protein [Cyclonatronum sp.]